MGADRGECVLKVLSWFRSKPALGAEVSPFADSWRLDQGVPPPRQRNAPAEPRQRSAAVEPRQQNVPVEPRQRTAPAQPRPKPEARSVQEIRRLLERSNVVEPALAPAPSRPRPKVAARRAVASAGGLAASHLEQSYGGRQDHGFLYDYRTRGRRCGSHQSRRPRRHQASHVSARAPRNRLPSPGSLDLPRIDRRGQYQRGVGNRRTRPRPPTRAARIAA